MRLTKHDEGSEQEKTMDHNHLDTRIGAFQDGAAQQYSTPEENAIRKEVSSTEHHLILARLITIDRLRVILLLGCYYLRSVFSLLE